VSLFRSAMVLALSSDSCTATRDEVIDNRNDCQHQKDVDEARCDMESEKSTEPHQQEYNSDDSKHFVPPELFLLATPSGEGPIAYLLASTLNTSNAVVGARDYCRLLFMELCTDDVCARRREVPLRPVADFVEGSVADGHNRYYAVPMNDAALHLFRLQVARLWHRALSRRSHLLEGVASTNIFVCVPGGWH